MSHLPTINTSSSGAELSLVKTAVYRVWTSADPGWVMGQRSADPQRNPLKTPPSYGISHYKNSGFSTDVRPWHWILAQAAFGGQVSLEPVFWEGVPFVGACPELSHTFPITEQLPDWYSPAPQPCRAHVPPLISPRAGAADTKSLKMAAETAIWGWSDSQGWREATVHPTLHSLDTQISLWDSEVYTE